MNNNVRYLLTPSTGLFRNILDSLSNHDDQGGENVTKYICVRSNSIAFIHTLGQFVKCRRILLALNCEVFYFAKF